jgi:hypothetical protein
MTRSSRRRCSICCMRLCSTWLRRCCFSHPFTSRCRCTANVHIRMMFVKLPYAGSLLPAQFSSSRVGQACVRVGSFPLLYIASGCSMYVAPTTARSGSSCSGTAFALVSLHAACLHAVVVGAGSSQCSAGWWQVVITLVAALHLLLSVGRGCLDLARPRQVVIHLSQS